MNRYKIGSVAPDGMKLAPNGAWVFYEDVQAAIEAAVFEEREQWQHALRQSLDGMRGLVELANRV